MSLLEQASLIVTPNAYKESKLYSVIPSDGSGDMDAVRATTATRVNELGLIENVGLNVPRIDYTNGSCPSILVEPQRTNLLLRSEEFDNAVWNKTRLNAFGLGSIANATTAPDGTTTADYIQQETGVTIVGGVNRAISVTSGTIYSLSVFAKQDDNRFLRLGFAIGTGSEGIFCNFDLQDGITGTPSAGITPTITNFGNGWFRCSISATSQVTANANQFIYQSNVLNGSSATENTGIFIWGAQLEDGSNATSYIPTVASSVTRNADVISKTGISGLINGEEGVVFVEMAAFQDTTTTRQIIIGSLPNDYIRFGYVNFGSAIQFRYYSGGALIFNNFYTTTITNFNKIAFGWQTNNFVVYENGVKKLEQLSGATSVAAFNSIDTSVLTFNGKIQSFMIFKTRLSNAELATLTTL